MAQVRSRQFVLASRPDGKAGLNDFRLDEAVLPALKDGEVLFRNRLISVDPYQRNLMGNSSSELPAIDMGSVMPGPTVAVVEQSNNPAFPVGDQVQTWSGWRERGVSDGSDLRKVDAAAAPASTALSVLGHTGLTAWGGMKLLASKPGGTVVVTAAAGSVGSIAAQIAKLQGHRVVGIAGGAKKVAFLKRDLGLDEAVDYKADDFADQLKRAIPEGIDGLYDNVGDTMFEALMEYFNKNARVVINGTIASYSNRGSLTERGDHLPRLLNLFLYRFIELRGFNLLDHLGSYPDFLAEATPWVADGRIKYAEEFVDGFDKIPETFLRLFDGSHDGKLIVKVD